MPFIRITTNSPLSIETREKIKSDLGKAITTIHKSEEWLMVGFDVVDKNSLYFQGSNENCAIVEISVYGSIRSSDFDPMTSKVTEIISKEGGLNPDRIYVNYREVEHWGLGGSNF